MTTVTNGLRRVRYEVVSGSVAADPGAADPGVPALRSRVGVGVADQLDSSARASAEAESASMV
jgi:hypothetical protein